MKKKVSAITLSLVILVFGLTACILTPVSQDASLTDIAQSAHGTMTAMAESTAALPQNATPGPEALAATDMPGATQPASETPEPVIVTQIVYVTATPGGVVPPGSSSTDNRLSMAQGATDLSTTGKVLAGKTVRYVFRALKGQLVNLTLSNSADAVLGMRNPGGTVLLPKEKGWTYFRVYLPEGGDWYIDVHGGKYDADFSLYMSIPVRLSFAAGSSVLSGKGQAGNGSSMQFIVYAKAGQNLKASVNTPGLGLSIYAVEGTVLKSPMGTDASYDGKLPVTGDYILNVFSAAGSAAQNFDLYVEIK